MAPIRQSRPEYGTEKAVTASTWHREGSQGQNMAHMRQSRPAYGTHKAVKAKFWPWPSDEGPLKHFKSFPLLSTAAANTQNASFRLVASQAPVLLFFSSSVLSGLKLSDTQVYEPYTRALLGTASHHCEVVVLRLRSCLGCGLCGQNDVNLRRHFTILEWPGDAKIALSRTFHQPCEVA